MKDFAEHFSDSLNTANKEDQDASPSKIALNNQRYFFETENRKDVISKVAHLIDYTHLVLFIQGAEGVGKTSVARQCATLADNNWRTSFVSAKNCTTENDFLETLVADFDLKIYSEPEDDISINTIVEQIDGVRHGDEIAVLIIDDVEFLHSSLIPVLAKLISQTEDSTSLLRLIVVGQLLPENIVNIIPREDEQASLKYLPILPFTLEETRDYIDFRLTSLGLEKHPLFDDEHIRQIHMNSSGIPKKINMLSDQLLGELASINVDPFFRPQSAKTNKNFTTVAIVLVAAIVSTIIILGMPDNQENAEDANLIPLQIPKESLNQSPVTVQANNEKREPVSSPTSASVEGADGQTQTPSALAAEVTNNAESTLDELLIKEDTAPTFKETPQESTLAKTASEITSTNNNTHTNELNWLNQQNASHYTIQLLGTSKESAARQFIHKHDLENGAKVIKTIRENKDWYIVIYQSYPTASSAKSARTILPSNLHSLNPWIRTFQSVKNNLPRT